MLPTTSKKIKLFSNSSGDSTTVNYCLPYSIVPSHCQTEFETLVTCSNNMYTWMKWWNVLENRTFSSSKSRNGHVALCVFDRQSKVWPSFVHSRSGHVYIHHNGRWVIYSEFWNNVGALAALSLCVASLLSPVIVAWCRRKSTRLTAVFGGLLAALGLLFTSFASQFHQLFLSYGLVLGKNNCHHHNNNNSFFNWLNRYWCWIDTRYRHFDGRPVF